MHRSAVSFAAVAFLFSSASAFALPLLREAPKLDPERPECVDFAGTWSGSCRKGDGAVTETTLTFQQDGCKALQSPHLGVLVPFAGSVTVSVAAPGQLPTTHTISIGWTDAKKTKAAMVETISGADGKVLNAAAYSGTMEIVDGKLQLSYRERNALASARCSLEKKKAN